MRTAVKFLFKLGLLSTLCCGVAAAQDVTVKDSDINVVSFEPLAYPAIARTAHVEGVVVIKVVLDDKGSVADAVALSGADLLIKSCLENAKKWRFKPNSEKAAIIVYLFRMAGFCHDNTDPSQFIWEPPNFGTVTACNGMAVY